MTLRKSALLSAIFLVGATLAANAQTYYPAYPYQQAPPRPPSWSYDPYTSGSAPCPQRLPGDQTTCQQQMPPTYGQPSYWPQR